MYTQLEYGVLLAARCHASAGLITKGIRSMTTSEQTLIENEKTLGDCYNLNMLLSQYFEVLHTDNAV